jgi:hypothetical protein
MPAVEAALYFACVSALGGTAAYSPAMGDRRPDTSLEVADGAEAGTGTTVELSVPLPGATVEPATLLAIRDRIGALGGTVTVDAAPGAGGRMTVLVPLEPEEEPLPAADGVAP